MSRETDATANVEMEKQRQANVRKDGQILHDLDADTRQRVDTLAKLIFAISGGALTVSLGLFLREGAPHLGDELHCILKIAWWSLFGSMAAFAMVLALLILDGYSVARAREKQLRDRNMWAYTEGLHKSLQFSNWFIGVPGFIAFLIGIGSLARVATGLL